MSDAAPPVSDFETGRLRLRRLAPEDAPGLNLAYGDADSMQYWDAPPCEDLAETERRIHHSLSVSPTWHAAWAVLTRDDDRFIGMVNYHARQPWNRRLAVGWILIPQARGQGYMTEAMGCLLAHCFEALETHRIEAEIEPANVRSARLADRLGFRCEGVLRDRLTVGGQARTIGMYALLRPEWHAATTAR